MDLHFPHRRIILKSKSSKLAITGMLLSTGSALLSTVWSVYLNSIFQNVALVGALSGILAVLGVFFLIFSTSILVKFPETKLWVWSLLASIIIYLLFYYVNSSWLIVILSVIMTFLGVIRIQSHGILVRDLSKASDIGKTEGLMYALQNIGWMLGPLISGFIAAWIGVRPVFIFVALFLIISYFIFKSAKIKDKNRFTEDDGSLKSSIKNLKHYFKDSERIKNYFLRGGVNAFWGTIFLFIPLFIVEKGFSEYWIGIFLFSTAVPLVVLEYFIGLNADKKGFKKFFVWGYLILSVCSFIAFFFTNIIAWMIIFVIAAIGAAMLEGTSEGYFFKITKRREEEKYYGPYNTSLYAISGLGKLIISGGLFYLANEYAFLILSGEMFLIFLIATSLKEKPNGTFHK